eukprot:456598-Hanusia_phi.AAC.1
MCSTRDRFPFAFALQVVYQTLQLQPDPEPIVHSLAASPRHTTVRDSESRNPWQYQKHWQAIMPV